MQWLQSKYFTTIVCSAIKFLHSRSVVAFELFFKDRILLKSVQFIGTPRKNVNDRSLKNYVNSTAKELKIY